MSENDVKPVAEETPPARPLDAPVDPVSRLPPPGGSPTGFPPPVDLWRDRIRVILDRMIYAAALVSIVYLAKIQRLDVGTTAAILLVAGVRPHNLFEAVSAARNGNGNGNGNASRTLPLLLLAPVMDNLRSGTWLAR